MQAFVSIGGTITPFSVPGATPTTTSGLNSSNQTAGIYVDDSGINHGFWRDSNGALHFPIDPPGSTATILFANNDSNWMVGRYMTADGVNSWTLLCPAKQILHLRFIQGHPLRLLTESIGMDLSVVVTAMLPALSRNHSARQGRGGGE